MSPRALVTGGAGFIGRPLVRELRRRGFAVRVLDDGSTGDLAAARAECDELIVGSACDAAAAERAVRGVSQVYHLAARVGVERVSRDPIGVLEENIQSTKSIVRACERLRAPIISMSSSEVYGEGGAGRLLAESDAPAFLLDRVADDGRAAYALSKWIGEEMVRAAARRGLRALIARPFNIIGPGQREDSGAVLARFLAAARRREPLRLYDDGGATRSFTDVADAARALADLAEAAPARGEAINLGGATQASVDRLARTVVAVSAAPVAILRGDAASAPPVHPIRHRTPDLAALRACIGWIPSAPLEATVRRAWETESAAASPPARRASER